MRTGYNHLRVKAYSGTTPVAGAELDRAEGLRFSTYYPGGLFGDCSFYVPRDVTASWQVKPNQRLVVSNGLDTAYEGYIITPGISVSETTMGQPVTAAGAWAKWLMSRKWRKPWADTRIDEGVWPYITSASAAELCTIDRNNRLRFTPKAVAWPNGSGPWVRYFAPTGETIKRVTFSYDLQEAAQQWEIALRDHSFTSTDSVTASGTGSIDRTFASPQSSIYLLFISRAAQTPASGGTIYGEFSSIVVYTETGSINLTEIAKDVRARVTELSSNETLIASNTLSLVPFISEVDSYADILTKAAGYGDSSYNAWACGVRESALSTDGKPILFVEQQPALTDYEYIVSIAEMEGQFDAYEDIDGVRNWIAVEYRDLGGRAVYVTPDDDATLKDTASISAYGEMHEWLRMDTTSLTAAKNYARRVLAQRKNPQWVVSSGITVKGSIRRKSSGRMPASQIRAGQRVKVSNWLNDVSGSGMTFLITRTDYDDTTETCQLSVGQPNQGDVWLARTLYDLSRGA